MAITIPILTDFNGRGIDRGVKQFQQLEGKGAKAGFAIRKAFLPAVAVLGGMALMAKQGVQGVMEDEAAVANLEATLKSTGNAVNTTAQGFFEFANKLQDTTGESAALITQGGAMLATFKNVRNEMGRGNQIFDRATVAALDLSKKGFGSLESSNKMLGKALNDPIKGITALSRAGVTFTDQQKKTIASLVASGKTLEAQKIILKEVEDQVGGTAEAFGQTTAGQLERSKRSFEELQKSLATALIPVIEFLATVFRNLVGWMRDNEKLVKVLIGVFGGLAAAIVAVNAVMKVLGTLSLLTNPIGLVIVAIAALTTGIILLWKKSETFRRVVETVWNAIKAVVSGVVDYFKGPVMAAWDVIKGAIDAISSLIKGDFSGAWDGLKRAAGGVIEWLKETLLGLPLIIVGLAFDIGKAIVTGIVNGAANLADKVWEAIKAMPSALLNLAVGWAEGLATIGGRIITYIKNAATGLAAAVWDNIKGFATALFDLIGGWKDKLMEVGSAIVNWIKEGIGLVWGQITSKAKAAVNILIDAVNAIVSGLNKVTGAINNVWPGPDIPEIPKIPRLAQGGIVTQPTVALIGEAGPEAVIPLNRRGAMGMTINVQAGLVSTPDQIGQQIIEAIQRAERRSGPAFMPA